MPYTHRAAIANYFENCPSPKKSRRSGGFPERRRSGAETKIV
ncbi:hypothetical protein [Chthoniobacter flavus]|nr:hypothetical protein [Chthoniobacter flavus]